MVRERQQGQSGGHEGDRWRRTSRVARGQTLHDYTVGISLFVLTLSTVLAGLFGFVGPLSTEVGSEEVSQSERVATTVVQNLSTGQRPNELDSGELVATLARSEDDLRTRWGIPQSARLNVTLTTLNGSRIVSDGGSKLTAGSPYQRNVAASTARVVTLDDGPCRPGCRLVVRAW